MGSDSSNDPTLGRRGSPTWATTITLVLWFLMMLPVVAFFPKLAINGQPISFPGLLAVGVAISVGLGILAMSIVALARAVVRKTGRT